jgi:hypothetical protein
MTSFNGRKERSGHTVPVMLNELNDPAVLQFAPSDRKIDSRDSSFEEASRDLAIAGIINTELPRGTTISYKGGKRIRFIERFARA